MEIRTLRAGEREALLDLLDGWKLADGWRGRDFFRRYVEGDPTFADENVWVAAEAGALLSCVQIFPRPLRIAGTCVETGGIGSVFTREDARRRGLAERVLAAAGEAMRARGMAVSLLFGEQGIYARLGWRTWGARAALLVREPGAAAPPAPPGAEIRAFERAPDLSPVRALHERYSDALSGTVVRDDRLWEHSLRNSGNPDEEFLVARAGGELVAYARATVLYGVVNLMEFACEPGFEAALAALVARILSAREEDPWERRSRPSAELRRVAVSAPLHAFAPELAAELARERIAVRESGDESSMLRCLDPEALAARVGERPRPGESGNDFLARLLPPADLTFWAADRF
jgi:predicted N-acetyltransferase YhbS